MSVGLRPVPSLRGSQGGRAPLTDACAPHFKGLLNILFLEHYSLYVQYLLIVHKLELCGGVQGQHYIRSFNY